MITISNTEIVGWEHVIRGMRNPMNSWDKSDSGTCMDTLACHSCEKNRTTECNVTVKPDDFIVGPKDKDLMMALRRSGTDHRKFMRMIVVYLDITAPLYWWKEFDTYKIGTVANSCSTMHKIQAKEFTMLDFSDDHLLNGRHGKVLDSDGNDITMAPNELLGHVICHLNIYRELYLKTKNKKYWWQMIQLLPSSYNQKRTVMLNYEVLANMYKSRRNHKLDEWHTLCDWMETLPYSELITEEAPLPTDNEIQHFYENAKLIDDQITTWMHNFKYSNVIELHDSNHHTIYAFNLKIVTFESALEAIKKSVEGRNDKSQKQLQVVQG